jgi:hypothetical protein
MHASLRRALCAVGFTGGLLLLGFGLAEAASADDTGPVTTGESGILSGNQTAVDARAPINVSGNQVTVVGQDNVVEAAGGSSTAGGSAGSGSPTTSGAHGIGSGNQTAVDARAPINVSGNQVTVVGQDNHVSSLGGTATGPGATGSTGGATTSGEHGLLSGNQTGVGVTVPIGVSGNQVTVIGQDNTLSSVGGSTAPTGSTGPGQTTTGAGGIGSGNQTPVSVQVPVDASGNQVTVVGQDNTVTSTGGSSAGGTPGGGSTNPPGGVVSPPTSGDETPESPQGSSTPGATVLPDTGMSGDLLRTGTFGLLLLLLGLGLCRWEGAARCSS